MTKEESRTRAQARLDKGKNKGSPRTPGSGKADRDAPPSKAMLDNMAKTEGVAACPRRQPKPPASRPPAPKKAARPIRRSPDEKGPGLWPDWLANQQAGWPAGT